MGDFPYYLVAVLSMTSAVFAVLRELGHRFLSRKKTLDATVERVRRATGLDISPGPKDKRNG
ncbi:hypothetical protein [Streptomyces sp. bgisy084]|uniref:hypothetical protein n=1 Tax=unclassified Streptomyces TaxID=2593676 RepID=UPI003D745B12